jgi:hypothetical protein
MHYNTLLSAASLIAGISAFENQVEEFVIEHNNPLKPASPEQISAFGNAVLQNRCPYDIYLWYGFLSLSYILYADRAQVRRRETRPQDPYRSQGQESIQRAVSHAMCR